MVRSLPAVLLTAGLGLLTSAGTLFRDSRQADFFNSVKSYELVIPQKVTSDGSFISHHLPHHYSWNNLPRIKRSTRNGIVHYRINLAQNDLYLELQPNYKLFAPGLVIERRSSNLNSTKNTHIKLGPASMCWFQGTVRNVSDSQVAMSACDGLRGVIRLEDEDYLIEPVKDHDLSENLRHPHVIYKRSALDPTLDGSKGLWPDNLEESNCGIKDKVDSVLKEREHWEALLNNKRTRRRRSVSLERNVETLVVADKVMMDYYSNEDIETYILTIMNMVSSLYHDASIGNAINVVLVRIILLENDEKEQEEDLDISHHAEKTLKSFCQWQKYVNPRDENHPNHHDVAILLTRYNICTRLNEPCSTLGLAEVAGMCQPHRSCNVNEDTGLALAYTIAHEMGHNFGMSHDSPNNGCQASHGERQHVMSPHLISDTSPLVWSNCSRNEITKFLDRDWGHCLDDEPSDHGFSFPQLPPGAMYDVDHQCRLQYGSTAEHCEGIEDVCQTLWCRMDKRCVTRLERAAEGTICGRNKWCFMGKCTTIGERPDAVDGEWGEWNTWSQCSRTCDAGITHSERHCDKPYPANGGRYCIGERKRYRICNTKSCPENSSNFRAVQCSRYDKVPYKEKLYSWIPVATPLTPCQLHCKPEGEFFSVLLADTVDDGTPCKPGTRDMCINGKCRHVACDWGIDSEAQEDRCGICHGDGTHCLTVRGEFKQIHGLGYAEIVTIPKGARNIRVEEIAEANNYIALQSEDGEFQLNGDWFIQWSGEYMAGGTTFYYNRVGEKESLHAPGPVRSNIRILLLFQTENPGITFEFTVPNKNATRKPEFHWEFTDWSICSATCGGGFQISRPKCMEKEAGLVESKYCNVTNKPSDITRTCNKQQCPARWWTGPWQHCSVTCGEQGIRQRTVICVRSLGPDEQIALLEEECKDLEKPTDQEHCYHKHPCPGDAQWTYSEWSNTCRDDPCNHQTRQVYCSLPNGPCDKKHKPPFSRQCSNITCGIWVVSDWSQCSVSCGVGLRFRKVTCQGGLTCHQATEPIAFMECQVHNCFTDSEEKTENSIQTEETEDAFQATLSEDNLEIPTSLPEDVSMNSEILTSLPENVSYSNEILTGVPQDVTDKKEFPKILTPSATNYEHPTTQLETITDNNILITSQKEDTDRNDANTKISIGVHEETPSIILPSTEDDNVKDNNETKEGITKKHHKHRHNHNRKRKHKKRKNNRPHGIAKDLVNATFYEVINDQHSGVLIENTKETIISEKPSQPKTVRKEPAIIPEDVEDDEGDTSEENKYQWRIGVWSQCSKVCDGGTRTREAMCLDTKARHMVVPELCTDEERPHVEEACNMEPCLKWFLSEWSACSARCGEGRKYREVQCPKPNACNPENKPKTTIKCFERPCLDWVAGPWSKCSATCGGGYQIRHVKCVNFTLNKRATGCDTENKPSHRQPCNSDDCPQSNSAFSQCKDKLDMVLCKSLRHMCSTWYFKVKCCQTCRSHRNPLLSRRRGFTRYRRVL